MPILSTTPDYNPTYPVENAISYTRSQHLLGHLTQEKKNFEDAIQKLTPAEAAIEEKIKNIILSAGNHTVFEFIAEIKTDKRPLPPELGSAEDLAFIDQYYSNYYPIYTIENEIQAIEKARCESPIEYARRTMTKTLEYLEKQTKESDAHRIVSDLQLHWEMTLRDNKEFNSTSNLKFPTTLPEYQAIKDRSTPFSSLGAYAQLKKVDAVMDAYFRNQEVCQMPVSKKDPKADNRYNVQVLCDTRHIWLPPHKRYLTYDLYAHQTKRKEKFENEKIPLTYPFKQTEKPTETIKQIDAEVFKERRRCDARNLIDSVLDKYLIEREKTSKNQYYWYGFFQCFPNSKSLTQKENAIKAFQEVLRGDSTNLNEEHISTLRNGKLGDTLRAFIKAGSANAIVPGKNPSTIRDFIETLIHENQYNCTRKNVTNDSINGLR